MMHERIWRERGLRDAVLSGDEIAWRTWYDCEFAPLQKYVHWRCAGMKDLVEDVLQETWLVAIKSMQKFQPETGSFHQWLCGIAANMIRNLLRKRQQHRMILPLQGELCNGLLDAQPKTDRSESIAFALANLSERYERVLRAKYLDQNSVEEIALDWEESTKAIESLLSRARAAFRDAYPSED
jgi:RNA polymerase sigma-70 factor (ECF subfamily)